MGHRLRDMRLRFAFGCSGIWLSIYVLCVVFVFSFVLFELLDVDGSDFPTGPAPTAVRTAEPPHDEIKRTPLQTTLDLHVAVLAIREPDSIAGSLDSVALRPSPFVSPRACRRLLARASLGDIPLSA